MTEQYQKLNSRHVKTLGSVVIKKKINSTMSGGKWKRGHPSLLEPNEAEK
jgi:hypothetical protein